MQRIDVIKVIAPFFTPEDLCVSSLGGLHQDWWNLVPPMGNTFNRSFWDQSRPRRWA
jgi:hypothetical protein